MMKPAPERLIQLPVVHQRYDFDCGAAVLQTVCRYYGLGPADEDEFLRLCRTDSVNGTDPEQIVHAARALGLAAEPREGMTFDQLRQVLDEAKPVVCAIQAWGEERAYAEQRWGHYVIAIGYDHQHVLFEDPGFRGEMRGHLTYDELTRRWHSVGRDKQVLQRYGIAVWSSSEPQSRSKLQGSARID